MANTLKIQKESPNKFWHYHNGSVIARFFISDFDISLDGSNFVIVQKDGATRYNYKVADITIQDLTAGGALETFVSPAVFLARLMAIGYTPFYTVTGLTVDELDAIHGANIPSAINPFATLADVGGNLANGFTTLGSTIRSGNTFTFTIYYWRINGVIYHNPVNISDTVPVATPGFYRTDIFVVDTNNNIYRIQGVEAQPISLQPETPVGTLLLSPIIIYGDTVFPPAQPPYAGQNNFVRTLTVNVSDLSGTGTIEQQICDYILSLQQVQRTIVETDSKWNIILTDEGLPPPAFRIHSAEFNTKFN